MKYLNLRERAHEKGFLQLACAGVLYLVVFFLYRATGKNEFAPDLSVKAQNAWLAAGILSLVLLPLRSKALTYIAYLCGLYAWLEFLVSQINYIANVFVAIDGSSFSKAFLATAVLGLAAWILAVAAAVRHPSVFAEKQSGKEEGAEQNEEKRK